MIAYSDIKPSVFETVGNGSINYNYNMVEVDAPTMEGETPRKQWKFNQVTVFEPITKKKVVLTVINETWNQNHEQKLVNEYNSATLGIITGDEATEKINAYKTFLEERKTLKASVEHDCDENGINN